MESQPQGFGPFETEQEAESASHPQELVDAPRESISNSDLRAACQLAGLDLGSYDRRVLDWLGDWQPQSVSVIAGLVVRAYHSGVEHGQEQRAQPKRDKPRRWPRE